MLLVSLLDIYPFVNEFTVAKLCVLCYFGFAYYHCLGLKRFVRCRVLFAASIIAYFVFFVLEVGLRNWMEKEFHTNDSVNGGFQLLFVGPFQAIVFPWLVHLVCLVLWKRKGSET